MPAEDHPVVAAPVPGAATAGGLVVAPFRGLRYVAGRVSDLAAVTSPPYDVIDQDAASHLEDLDPHNVVRLILPRDRDAAAAVAPGSGDRYAHAAQLLDQWQAEGVLARDPRPALYVYEQAGAGYQQRGLLAAVGLHDPADRVVLPHEDVMPGPVADRLELMRATSANLEPILLVYDGGGETAAVLDEVVATSPLLETRTEDGVRQRVWAVTDPAVQGRVAADLAPRQALIADGHHRWATYRRLQAEHRELGDGAGPWDSGLAMLVDSRTSPMQVAAIHRVVPELGLADAIALAGTTFTVSPAGNDLETALAALRATSARHPFVVTDGSQFHLLTDPDPETLADALPADRPDRWRELDASVLHALLLEQLWGRAPDDPQVGYLHDAPGAVRAALRSNGVAVLLRPVDAADVVALAADGERMPRKSTSFGPKPRTGLVLRLLDE